MNQIKVELQEVMGSDRSIAEAAWTSSSEYKKRKSRSKEDIERVINMLADNRHSTPFESVVFRFWIKMPIATDRQYMTHRIQSASGLSARYRTMPSEYLEISKDIEDILKKVPNLTYPNPTNTELNPIDEYTILCETANNFYQSLIQSLKIQEKTGSITNPEFKRLREFFRGVLPQHNMTERVSIMNLRSFANFIKLRLSTHAQPEIREAARQMLEAVETSNVAPIAISALKRNSWNI